jgi:nucleoside-diphosphate-sugar epimerase
MPSKKILITGMSGLIGTIVRQHLEDEYSLRALNRRADVKRVVFASSGSTMNGWEREIPYNALVAGNYAAVSPNWPHLTHPRDTVGYKPQDAAEDYRQDN